VNKVFAIIAILTITCASLLAQHRVERTTEVYAVKGQDTLVLDIYVDQAAQVNAPRPMMIYVHGGGFSMGSRKNVMQEFFSRHYAEMGWVSVSIDYRLGASPNALTPDQQSKYGCRGVHDIIRLACQDLVDATVYLLGRKELAIDPTKVLISGGSAGAITCVTTEYDICKGADYTKKLPEGFNYAGVISHSGSVGELSDTLVWKNTPCPMLLMHGSEDQLVPLEKGVSGEEQLFGSKYLYRQFAAMGVPCWLYIEKGADHCIAMKGLDLTYEADRFYKDFVENPKAKQVSTEWEESEPAAMQDIEHMIKFVPMYILGYEKYLEEMDWSNLGMPTEIKY